MTTPNGRAKLGTTLSGGVGIGGVAFWTQGFTEPWRTYVSSVLPMVSATFVMMWPRIVAAYLDWYRDSWTPWFAELRSRRQLRSLMKDLAKDNLSAEDRVLIESTAQKLHGKLYHKRLRMIEKDIGETEQVVGANTIPSPILSPPSVPTSPGS